MTAKKHKIITDAFIASLPVMAGYLVLGMGFGILLEDKGYNALWALLMSVTMFSGSLQYVGVELLASGASVLTTALTTIMVQARHLFYGISLIDTYKGQGIKKAYMIFGLTDENYSLVTRGYDPLDSRKTGWYCFYVTLFDHLYWITGCVLGALIGAIIPFSTEGVDFVLTALFVTIFVEQWISEKDHAAALIGVACTAVCLIVFGSEQFLIPSMIAIMLALTIMRFIKQNIEKKKPMLCSTDEATDSASDKVSLKSNDAEKQKSTVETDITTREEDDKQ